MDKAIKTLKAEKKLNDEFILKALKSALTADNQDADEDLDENEDVDETPTIEDETDEDASDDEEQPDMRALVREILAEELKALKGGKPAPKVKPKKNIPKQQGFQPEYGKL